MSMGGKIPVEGSQLSGHLILGAFVVAVHTKFCVKYPKFIL